MRTMSWVAAVLLLVASLRCSSNQLATSTTTAEDFQRVETLLDLDRSIGAVVDAARQGGVHPELRTFADEIGHRHFTRIEALAAWKRQSSAPSQIAPLSIPCVQPMTVPSSTGVSFDIDAAKQLLRHRECGIGFAHNVVQETRDSGLKHIAEDFITDYSAEAKQVQEWVRQWTAKK